MDRRRVEAWLGLTLLPGWGLARIWHAMGQSPDVVSLWKRVGTTHVVAQAQQTLQSAKANGVSVITWDDPQYPENLRKTSHPAPVLYVRGSLEPIDNAGIAIVGSRRASPHALQLAFILARDLASAGITIISGLASGVDAAAHRGALQAGGRTIAVLASGTDCIYPRNHVGLANEVALSGALLTQYPCGVTAQRYHFPIRNQTLAGLAMGTVVVEAAERSGALITANQALAMGREVMVCPGDALREQARGSNLLLRDGARSVLDAGDILAELYEPLKRIVGQTETDASNLKLFTDTDLVPVGQKSRVYTRPPVHTQVWEAILQGRSTVDELMHYTGKSNTALRQALAELEVLGYVNRMAGDNYRLVEK